MANDPITYLADEPDALLPSGVVFGWEDYATALTAVESLLVRLFSEASAADAAAESALSAADGALDGPARQIRSMQSDVAALQSHADLLSAQALPVTGGQYTHLVAETFSVTGVRDVVSSYDRQPLAIKAGVTTGCPPRPALEVDQTTQTLRQKREGTAVVFEGLPGQHPATGGIATVDKVFGTPVTNGADTGTNIWEVAVGSRSPLAPGFSGVGPSGVPGLVDVPKPAWLPDAYASGGAARLRLHLTNPSPCTEVRLRGALLPGDAQTLLLETVAAVDSRPDVTDLTSQPTRPITQTGTFNDGFYPWQNITPGITNPTLVAAPGRTGGNDRAAQVYGLIGQPFDGLTAGGHAVLRYRASLPATGTSPIAVKTSFVQVYYYASANPTFGIDSPLDVETFKDALPSQAGSYAGWIQSVHLLSVPNRTQTALLVVGADPFLFQGNAGGELSCSVCYSDVWICDEAITRQYSVALPRPSASQLSGPTGPSHLRPYVNEDSVDSLSVGIGNDTGALVISDVWVTVGQQSPSIEDAGLWEPYDSDPLSHDSFDPPPYALNLPAEAPRGRAARDPLLLHQARYAGVGTEEYNVSQSRLSGRPASRLPALETAPLRASTGLPAAPGTLGGQRSALPAAGPVGTGGYWKGIGPISEPTDPGFVPLDSGLAARWKNLYATLSALTKARNAPPSRALRILAPQIAQPSTITGSLYVYSMGLSSLSLLRHEYAGSGLYVTNPIRAIDGDNGAAVPAEIHEVSLVTDPPLATLNNRVRFWVIPDRNGGGTDSPSAQLARAVPLDTNSPRATFHSAVESRPGLSPAQSDTASSFGIAPPAFYVTPSVHTQVFQNGINPDASAQGVRLDYVPYINREAIYNIAYAIAAGDATNPNVYDPNAVRPIIDYLSNFDSGFVSSVTANNDPTAHVEPGSINTASLPFLDQNQMAVKMVQPYTLDYTVTSMPAGVAANTTLAPPTTIINGDGTVSVNFVAPVQEGAYSFDATATFPGPPTLTYVVHVGFTVKKAYTSSDILKAVTGYRPVAIKLRLPSGRVILPDSLGSPRPGEIIYEPNEVLQTAQNLQLTNNAASTAEYSFTSATSTSDATQVLTTQQRSFVTAHSPVAAGAQGTAIDLYWHRSSEFDPAQGGILNRYDIKIPPSEYVIDAHTGQITVNAQPPYNWDTVSDGYDQVVAKYFWRVGDIAPREWFPPPSIYDVQTFTGSPLDFIGSPVETRPATVTPTVGPTPVQSPYGEIMTSPDLASRTPWTLSSGADWNNGGVDSPATNVATLTNRENVLQDVTYLGPGIYQAHIIAEEWKRGGGEGGGHVTVSFQVYSGVYSTDNIIEEYGPVPIDVSHSVGNVDGYKSWPDDQTLYTSDDINNSKAEMTTVIDRTAVHPLKMRVIVQNADDSNDRFHGTDVAQVSVTATLFLPDYVCPTGYTLSSDKTVCNLVPVDISTSTSITVSGGTSAGEVADAPTDVASLLKGPVSQSYPITRNVTNYSSSTPATMQAANMDPLSPDYYPVIEYRIDPGGILRFGTDLSTLGPFAGTEIEVTYEYLDINPRFAAEVLPEGETPLTPPGQTPDLTRPDVDTVGISSILFLINARY